MSADPFNRAVQGNKKEAAGCAASYEHYRAETRSAKTHLLQQMSTFLPTGKQGLPLQRVYEEGMRFGGSNTFVPFAAKVTFVTLVPRPMFAQAVLR
jgi:hypothetical protein